MASLAQKKCVPCSEGARPFTAEQIKPLIAEIPGWKVVENHHIFREFKFPDFKSALDFVNRIGDAAEREGHHPDITLSWGKVGVTLFTHKIGGLHENDFIMAAKISGIFSGL